MPDKKVYCVKKKNVTYVYYILKAYRNKKGQPTCDSVLIGKKEENNNMLIPNMNYFNYFDCEIIVNYKGVKNDYR